MSSRVRASAVAVKARRGTPGKSSAKLGQQAVFGAELVAPLADAVRLVDGHQRHAAAAQPLQRARHPQPLGRDVEQIEPPGIECRPTARCSSGGWSECSAPGRHAQLPQCRHLVVHQRDQRRDHDRRAGPAQRRHLVADALAAAGRHQHQRVAAVHYMLYDRLPAVHGNSGTRKPAPALRPASASAAPERAALSRSALAHRNGHAPRLERVQVVTHRACRDPLDARCRHAVRDQLVETTSARVRDRARLAWVLPVSLAA